MSVYLGRYAKVTPRSSAETVDFLEFLIRIKQCQENPLLVDTITIVTGGRDFLLATQVSIVGT